MKSAKIGSKFIRKGEFKVFDFEVFFLFLRLSGFFFLLYACEERVMIIRVENNKN